MKFTDLTYKTRQGIYIRGGVLMHTVSPNDPYGIIYVKCTKHDSDWISVPGSAEALSLSQTFVPDHIVEAAEKAIALCAGCVDEKAWNNTRWPNVGEPGGAEL